MYTDIHTSGRVNGVFGYLKSYQTVTNVHRNEMNKIIYAETKQQ